MAGTLQAVAWEACLLEPRRDPALETYARRKFGVPHPSIRYYVPVPWAVRAVCDLHPEFGLLVRLDLKLADLIQLVVSQENSCRYCYAAIRAMLRIQGMSEARIQALEADVSRADLTPRGAAAMAFARALSRSGPAGAPAARRALLEAGFDAEEMREIAFVSGAMDFMNRLSTIVAIPPHEIERMPERLHVRLLRPLIARLLESRRRRGRATLPERPPAYPYAMVVRAFAGSPIAQALGRTLEEMWASPALPRRCKLLLFAVVARGLECSVCAAEAARALSEGGLGARPLADIVTHLDAAELDPVERVLVPFASETIWYEPAMIQRRARAVRDRLSPPQFLEAVAVLSLANGLCRIGAVVGDHG